MESLFRIKNMYTKPKRGNRTASLNMRFNSFSTYPTNNVIESKHFKYYKHSASNKYKQMNIRYKNDYKIYSMLTVQTGYHIHHCVGCIFNLLYVRQSTGHVKAFAHQRQQSKGKYTTMQRIPNFSLGLKIFNLFLALSFRLFLNYSYVPKV